MKFSILLLLILLQIKPAQAQDGKQDTTFGVHGKVIADINNGDFVMRAALVQTDDKILIVGYDANTYILARYDENGNPDKSFGKNGMVITPIVELGNAHISTLDVNTYALCLQKDGKILLGGISYYDTKDTYTLLRYNQDGTIDSTFNKTGMVHNRLFDFCTAIAIQQDGKINTTAVTELDDITINLLRYNQDGTLDSSFGTNGVSIISFGADGLHIDKFNKRINFPHNVAVLPNQDILVAVNISGHAYLVKCSANGTIINNLDIDNYIHTFPEIPYYTISSMLLSNNRILLACSEGKPSTSSNFLTICFNQDETIDKNFGKGGYTITYADDPELDYSYSIATQSDGKILFFGSADTKSKTAFQLVRYNPNGMQDNTFGSNGILLMNFGERNYGEAMGLQKSGKIIVIGISVVNEKAHLVISRYLSGTEKKE